MNTDSQCLFCATAWLRLLKLITGSPGVLFLTTALAVFLLGQPFAKFDPFPHHEGSILYPAYAANHGLLPLKDVTLQHLPTTSLLYAMVFRVFGETLIVSRFFTLIGISCFAGLLASLSRRFLPWWIAFCFAVSYALSSWLIWDLITRPWPTLWAMCLLLSSGLAFCDYVITGKRGLLVLAGVCAGGVFLFRMNLGMYVCVAFVSILAWLAWSDRKKCCASPLRDFICNIVTFSLPVMLLVGLVLVVYIWKFGVHGFSELLVFQRHIISGMQECMMALYGNASQYSLLHDLGVSRDGLLTFGLYILTFVVGCAVLYSGSLFFGERIILAMAVLIGSEQLRFHRLDIGIPVMAVALWDLWKNNLGLSAPERSRYFVLLGMAAAAWGVMYPGHDERYFAWGGGVIFLLIAVRLYWLWRASCGEHQSSAIILGAFSILLWLLTMNVTEVKRLLRTLESPRVPISSKGFYQSMVGDSAAGRGYSDYSALSEFIQKHSSSRDTILILDGESLHAADWGRVPASLPYISLDILVYRLPNGQEIERTMISQFLESPPALVVKVKQNWEVPSVWFQPAFPKLKAYIETFYQPVWESPSGFFTVLAPCSTGIHNKIGQIGVL